MIADHGSIRWVVLHFMREKIVHCSMLDRCICLTTTSMLSAEGETVLTHEVLFCLWMTKPLQQMNFYNTI